MKNKLLAIGLIPLLSLSSISASQAFGNFRVGAGVSSGEFLNLEIGYQIISPLSIRLKAGADFGIANSLLNTVIDKELEYTSFSYDLNEGAGMATGKLLIEVARVCERTFVNLFDRTSTAVPTLAPPHNLLRLESFVGFRGTCRHLV